MNVLAEAPQHLITLAGIAAPYNGRPPNKTIMRRRTINLLHQFKNNGALPDLLNEMANFTGLPRLLPEQYSHFQPIVTEGMQFVLNALPMSRLAEKIVDQLRLPFDAEPGTRVSALVKDMPAIQKLGQVICRSPGIDPQFRKALTDLEDNLSTVRYHHVHPAISKQLDLADPSYHIVPEKHILAEASVCAVIPADVTRTDKSVNLPAVLKIVKPAVRRHMVADIRLWDRLAAFMDAQRAAWGMREFNFSGTFNQVRRLIENEVALAVEQENLSEAGKYYKSDKNIIIPELLPPSTPDMTVMTRESGNKITDVDQLDTPERRRLAEALTNTCILSPMRDAAPNSLFHGDPHAGNIAYRFKDGQPVLIFYDWAMMGRLSRRERFTMALLAFGFIARNPTVVRLASDMITKGQISRDPAVDSRVTELIDTIIQNGSAENRGLLASIETYFEELTYMGITFSTNLMMYEKAMVTLKGVISHIDPTFDRNDYLIWSGMAAFLSDVVLLRFHRILLAEAWAYTRHQTGKWLDLQKEIGAYLIKAGTQWFKADKQ